MEKLNILQIKKIIANLLIFLSKFTYVFIAFH